MIIKGSFDPETWRPYCQGLLFIPRLRKTSPIDWIVDTGSDVTTLNPGDGKRMKIDYTKLRFTEPAIAVGSRHEAALLQAIIAFVSDEGVLPIYNIQIHITPYSLEAEKLPSMLGIDILHRWKMNWNPRENILEFEIITYDKIISKSLFDDA